MFKKFIIYLLPFTALSASSQVPSIEHYMASPNMASLGEYGSVPVSLFTGIPQISIPIYNIESRGHTIPISLSYHGGGVHPDRHPGWVGLGWTLLAGGSITRVVNGLPDESNCYNLGVSPLARDYETPKMGLFYNPAIATGNIYQQEKGNFAICSHQTYHEEDLLNSKQDTEPDLFSFNVPGLTGQFYFRNRNDWAVICDRPVKIVMDTEDTNNFRQPFFTPIPSESFKKYRSESITNFKIIDDTGVIYTFGGTDDNGKNAIEYSIGFFSQSKEEIVAVAWHLTSILYPDGTEVNFKYKKKDWVAQFSVNEVYTRQILEHNTYDCYNGEIIDMNINSMSISPGFGFAQGSLISPSYLSEISVGHANITFETEETNELKYDTQLFYNSHFSCAMPEKMDLPYLMHYYADDRGTDKAKYDYDCFNELRWYKLTDIKIRNNTGQLLKNFHFTYNDEDPVRAGKERLALLSVTEKDKNETSDGRKYLFEYDRLGELPDYCTYDIDHWGFYKKTGIAEVVNTPQGKYIRRRISLWPTSTREDSLSHVKDSLIPFDPNIGIKYARSLKDNYLSTDSSFGGRTNYEKARDASTQYATLGALTKITYPTGGYNRFVYENHTYKAAVDTCRVNLKKYTSSQLAGGLRIKEIYESSDGISESLSKKYLYYDPFVETNPNLKTSGILLNNKQYHIVLQHPDLGPIFGFQHLGYTIVYNSQSVQPCAANGDGIEVGYSCVTEVLPDNSMLVNYFTNVDDGHADVLIDNVQTKGLSVYLPYASRAMERGLLKQRFAYNAKGIRERSQQFLYEPTDTFLRETNSGVPAQIVTSSVFCHCITIRLPRFFLTDYKELFIKEAYPKRIFTYGMRQVGEKTKEYLNGDLVRTSVSTTAYDKRFGLPYLNTIQHPDNSEDIRTTQYCFQYGDGGIDYYVSENMLNRHMIGLPLKQSSSISSVSGVSTELEQTLCRYDSINPGMPNTVITRKGVNAPQDSTLFKYIYGNRLAYQFHPASDKKTVYVWGYNGEHVVASITNADIPKVEKILGSLEDFAKKSQPDFTKLFSLYSALPGSMVTIYKYIPGVGMQECSAPDGSHRVYHYDNFNRLKYISDEKGYILEMFDYHFANP